MKIPESEIYEEQDIEGLANYLEENKGEKMQTAEIRLASTANDGLNTTEDVYRALEELEKASFVELEKDALDDSWKVNKFYDADEAISYLTQENYTGRRSHPLGTDFNRKEVKQTQTLQQLLR